MAFFPYHTNRLVSILFLLIYFPSASAVAVINITQLTYGTNISYGNPSWSSDGSKIAYTAGSDDSYNIWVMNSDGSNPVQITNEKGVVDTNPSWSPDGSRIVFQRTLGDGSSFIYVITSDGSNQKKLIGAARNPSISPDGRYIAFDAGGVKGIPVTPEQGYGVFVMSIEGTDVKRLTNDFGDEVVPSWSPDGKKIIFTKDGIIHIMNADGSNMTSIGQGGYYASWSPDGKRIAFVSEHAGDKFRNFKIDHIYIMDMDGTNVTQLTFGDKRWDKTFDWSPDGTKIVFTSEVPPTLPYAINNIYIMSLDFNVTITPTPTITATQTPTVTPATPSPTQTPVTPGFSLLVALASISMLVLIKRSKR